MNDVRGGNMWVAMTELISFSDLPSSLAGLHKKAKREAWKTRLKPGVKGKVLECEIGALPLTV
ncbi:DNA-binding protein, partial [Escherichia coli]